MPYTSFCWSIGTTSFRTKEFNKHIEQQMELLNEFWNLPKISGKTWKLIQEKYYDFMKAKKFVYGNAPNKSKDAREKTSGLVDIGLLDEERHLTEAGFVLLDIVRQQAFNSGNQLQIANDSYIYFKQLCKTFYDVDGDFVRPYLVVAYVLSKVGTLSYEEFTFLLPLITNEDKLKYIVTELRAIRAKTRTVDDVIIGTLMKMPNYQKALDVFLSNKVTQKLIMEIGINRKSGSYDAQYFDFYIALEKLVFKRTDKNLDLLFEALAKIKGKTKNYWKQKLFCSKIKKGNLAALNLSTKIFSVKTEEEFRREFFKLLHLCKAKSTLSDYFDLNRRYFKTTDTLIFKDEMIDFDVIPKCYFTLIADKILPIAFSKPDNLYANCEFAEIIPDSAVADSALFAQIEKTYGKKMRNVYDVKKFIQDERIDRFNNMIDKNFTKEVLIDLLAKFETRKDEAIQKIIAADVDIPTLFEYIIGIIWYNISERKVDILNSFNLSLDADLLPKSHAGGGHEDITFKYEAASGYPKHTMLLEVTLSEGTNQRRMEMEPVSRHLGDYMLKHKEEEAYCVFISTYLHINVISDFRARKNIPYHSNTNSDFVSGMKIIPCQTSELRKIIKKDITYSDLYSLFETAYNSTDAPREWYQNNITL
jgi:hypothetical protein